MSRNIFPEIDFRIFFSGNIFPILGKGFPGIYTNVVRGLVFQRYCLGHPATLRRRGRVEKGGYVLGWVGLSPDRGGLGFGDPILVGFASFFGYLFELILVDFPSQLGKIETKSVPRCIPSWDSIFGSILDRFSLPTWTPWKQFGSSRLAPNAFFLVFWEIDFWFHFGANLVPFCHPKITKIMKKQFPRCIKKNDRFLHRFFGHLGSILGAKLGQNFTQNGGGRCWKQPSFCCALCFFLTFSPSWSRGRGYPIGPPSFWKVFGSMLAPFGLHFCAPGGQMRSILEGFGATFRHVFVNSGDLS